MCWLVFIGIGGYRGDPMLAFKERRLVAEPTRNPTVAVMGASAAKFAVSDGHCACSLYYDSVAAKAEDPELLRKRYTRKGWTTNRIERAITARLAAHQSNEKARLDRSVLPQIVTALTSAKADVFLLAHYFNGSFDTAFDVSTTERVNAADFSARGGRFAADTLVTIPASDRRSGC
jgi:hypothetical protein